MKRTMVRKLYSWTWRWSIICHHMTGNNISKWSRYEGQMGMWGIINKLWHSLELMGNKNKISTFRVHIPHTYKIFKFMTCSWHDFFSIWNVVERLPKLIWKQTREGLHQYKTCWHITCMGHEIHHPSDVRLWISDSEVCRMWG